MTSEQIAAKLRDLAHTAEEECRHEPDGGVIEAVMHGLISDLIDLADELAPRMERVVTASTVATAELKAAIEAARVMEQPKIWAEMPIAAVRSGDVIRMPGQAGSERTVEGVSPVLRWHVHPAANQYRPNEKRAEWSEVKMRFAGIEQPLSFTDPAFVVEIQTTQIEADAMTLLGGWGART